LPLQKVLVRPIVASEIKRYQDLMQEHHYLGHLSKIGETLWYIALLGDVWIALFSFSAAALKCAARDHWIGWSYRQQNNRLELVVNNSRFLILPAGRMPNMGSRLLSLCQQRLASDWQETFGHPVLLLETFVDPEYFRGTVYRAANWQYLGDTKGFRRTSAGYSAHLGSPKMVFVKPLRHDAQMLLSSPRLAPPYQTGSHNLVLTAEHMRVLPHVFMGICDPRRTQGRRHRLTTVLAIAAGAVLCGARGYLAISAWAGELGDKARERFGCQRINDSRTVPSVSTMRKILLEIGPDDLDSALQGWNETYGQQDESLILNGNTMCTAIKTTLF
jgi:Domain of unknown function (DUF4338)/DDE_Tnp_1-associated